MLLAAVVLACLLTATFLCVLRPTLPHLALVAALTIAWVLTNGLIEGPVLVSFTRSHGLTVADLAVFATIPAVASYAWSRGRRGPARPTDHP